MGIKEDIKKMAKKASQPFRYLSKEEDYDNPRYIDGKRNGQTETAKQAIQIINKQQEIIKLAKTACDIYQHTGPEMGNLARDFLIKVKELEEKE